MDTNIKYITENFLEWGDLCRISGISTDKLAELIENELVPNPSYLIDVTSEIYSPLGDRIAIKETKKYFSKNVVELIANNKLLEDFSSFKAQVKADFIYSMNNSDDKKLAYDGILNDNGTINRDKLNSMFEIEWKYYCQGIYGICTLNSTGSDIAKKEMAVKKLIEFNKIYSEKKLNKAEKEKLESLNNQYNEVSNLFAPYQRESSSRGKYLDKILNENGLGQLVKKYHQ